MHYDPTSIYFEGENSEEELLKLGCSRDHQPDAKQIHLELNVTHDGSIPIHHTIRPGNTADVTTVDRKAFRISKTDLRVRPAYHYRKRRIEAHISITFVAYAIYKELEHLLAQRRMTISPQRASELTHTMYELEYRLPDSGEVKRPLLKMDAEQQALYDIIYES